MREAFITNVLMPTDFSSCSQAAFPYACLLAGQAQAKLHLLHVIEPPTPALLPDGAFVPPMLDSQEDVAEVKAELHRWLRGEHAANLSSEADVRVGTPLIEILSFAEERSCDLIVMGTHGRTGVAHLLIGIVAENIVRKAKCPVLTVPERPSK